ncbi:MAG: (d)CMP kinase [Desulfitobacteriaceae bacterium]|nr:(d)CMP kinase [Desulfitobacteriaceae bacterium]
MVKKTIAIDGPAGAGKSTVARLVAKRLGYLYIDTGAMYRALTLLVMNQSIPVTNEEEITALAKKSDIKLINNNGRVFVYCNGINVTEKIRQPEVSHYVSQVAAIPGVRKRLVELQRAMTGSGRVVMDGRDIATTVLPHADCKFFLTASVAERARRRYRELIEKGFKITEEEIEADIRHRDVMDSQRKVSPLVCAPDAIVIDSTNLTVTEVVDTIIGYCERMR